MLFSVAAATSIALTAPGPSGPLAGSFIDAGKSAPVVIIVPGSGPTDRDGNNPLGVTAASYRLLAEALGQKGVSTVRIDKRGMFGSKGAVPDANAVTIADYAADVRSWVGAVRQRSGARCVWLLGHSEGGLVALASAQEQEHICGLVLVSAPGRKMGDVLREQLRANPANAPLLTDAVSAIDRLERGERVDVSAMHPGLQALFAPRLQPFLMDLMSKDPKVLAARVSKPLLIVSGAVTSKCLRWKQRR
jgi:alpha-beta hydrolase superfamily lysophospholipase